MAIKVSGTLIESFLSGFVQAAEAELLAASRRSRLSLGVSRRAQPYLWLKDQNHFHSGRPHWIVLTQKTEGGTNSSGSDKVPQQIGASARLANIR